MRGSGPNRHDGVMTETPPATAPAYAVRPQRRGGGDARLVVGVCAGLGRYTGIDPVVLRVAVAVLTIAPGIGLLVYLVGFLTMPNDGSGRAVFESATGRRLDGSGVLTVLGLLVALAFGLTLLGGPGNGTLTTLVVLVLGLLTAHTRGLDLGKLVRTLPERLTLHVPEPPPGSSPGFRPEVSPRKDPQDGDGGRSPGEAPGTAGPAFRDPHVHEAHEARASGPDEPESPRPGPGVQRSAPTVAESTGAAPGRPGAERPAEPTVSAARPPRDDDLIDLAELRAEHRPVPPRPASGPPPHEYVDLRTVARRAPRRRSFLGLNTILLALVVGSSTVTALSGSHGWGSPYVYEIGFAAALVVVGAGLLVGAWYGRARSLFGAGSVFAVALVAVHLVAPVLAGSDLGRFGDVRWQPRTVGEAAQPKRLALGDGLVDLTDLRLSAGRHVRVPINVLAGDLRVVVPRDAEVRFDGYTEIGGIRLDGDAYGDRHHVVRTLEPADAPRADSADAKKPPVIEIRLRGKLTDLEVRRAP